ncbi:MAG TPA: glycoside hydrolase family 43 protein [Bacteroidota bacterium]|nr:glycoside hydrolase family 43 protein [Bacteroidota bacterium]
MKKYFLVLLMGMLSSSIFSQNKEFTNPILAGFYPDPSVCKVGDDYYLVNSTFAYFPGIPVFHSKDLVHWKLIGHVLDRPEQLNLDGAGVSRGLFAPTIRSHHGIFYVTCTLVDKGGNFVVTATNPAGPWSNPVWLTNVNGIDPSLVFDENGKSYLIYNSDAPENKPLYQGHRTIRMREFDCDSLKTKKEEIILVNGGVDITKKPVWIEGPHIFYKDGFYYLCAAEGGTSENHSQVIFRSTKVEGPYQPYEHNPILTQRDLDPHRKNPITSTGHADLTQAPNGEWWAVFLGCRPYDTTEALLYNTGRETFLAPVKWENAWPTINPGKTEVQYFYPSPAPESEPFTGKQYSGNFTLRDDFTSDTLDPDWMFLRTPRGKWYDLKKRNGFLALQVRPEDCAGASNPTFLGHRQQHLQGAASMAMEFDPTAENEKAGLLIFQNETHFYLLCKSIEGNKAVVQLYQSAREENSPQKIKLIASQKIPAADNNAKIILKIEAKRDRYAFAFGFQPHQWTILKDDVDGTFLSTRTAGGFVGCMYAMYATSLGKPSSNTAYIDWFEYQGNDEVYNK